MIERELDLYYLLTSLQKLRAGMTALIGNNKELMEKTWNNYKRDIEIETEKSQDEGERIFMKFINSDQKEETVENKPVNQNIQKKPLYNQDLDTSVINTMAVNG